MANTSWEAVARNILRAELRRRGLTYDDLVARLAGNGTPASVAAVKNKVCRGRFTFVFFLQAMAAIGVDTVQIPKMEAA